MLTKKDVENILSRADADTEWQYWRNSGSIYCWLTRDREWLLQVSHERNMAAICDIQEDGYEVAGGEYTDDRAAVKFVALAAEAPQTAYDHLYEQDVTTTIKIGGEQA